VAGILQRIEDGWLLTGEPPVLEARMDTARLDSEAPALAD
jgi:hypothetical protein